MINSANCIRNNNQETNGTIEKGSYAKGVTWIANISHRLGGKSLEYLPGEMKFRNNPEADAYVLPNYQNGWKFSEL